MVTASRWRRWGLLIPWLPLFLLQVKSLTVHRKDNSTEASKELTTLLPAPLSALPRNEVGGRSRLYARGNYNYFTSVYSFIPNWWL